MIGPHTLEQDIGIGFFFGGKFEMKINSPILLQLFQIVIDYSVNLFIFCGKDFLLFPSAFFIDQRIQNEIQAKQKQKNKISNLNYNCAKLLTFYFSIQCCSIILFVFLLLFAFALIRCVLD